MSGSAPRLLLIDDTPAALKLLAMMVETMGWDYETAQDGEQALAMIQAQQPGYYGIIVSDWMMPKMDGLALLKALKTDPQRRHIPVILQTALADKENMQRGLSEGAFYYLTKPLDIDLVHSVIRSALRDYNAHHLLRKELSKITQSFGSVTQAEFHFKTIEQARGLSVLLASLTHKPQDTVVGIFELLINAVEHGNLGITYHEKSQLIEEQKLVDEVEHRLTLEPFKDKYVTLKLQADPEKVEFVIKDMGSGFDFEQYLQFSLERSLDNHGRGIMMANNCGFDSMEYSEAGRQVTCRVARG